MTDSKLHERRVCRVEVNASDLLKEGLPLPHGAEIVRIVPIVDRISFDDHYLFIRHESLPEVPPHGQVPIRRIIVEIKEREIGPYTVLRQKESRFAE